MNSRRLFFLLASLIDNADRLPPKQVRARHVLCILGAKGSFDDLARAAAQEIARVAPGFEIDLDFSIAAADERMSGSFALDWDRVCAGAFTPEDQDAVARHGAIFYILSPPMDQAASVEVSGAALELVDRLLRQGAVAAKAESAGVAHGVARWTELAAQARTARAAGDALWLCRTCRLAFAKRPVVHGDHLASLGFHLVGLPDVAIPYGTRQEGDIVREIDRAADVMADQGVAAAISMLDGELDEDCRSEPDDFEFNPFGVIRARRRLN